MPGLSQSVMNGEFIRTIVIMDQVPMVSTALDNFTHSDTSSRLSSFIQGYALKTFIYNN